MRRETRGQYLSGAYKGSHIDEQIELQRTRTRRDDVLDMSKNRLGYPLSIYLTSERGSVLMVPPVPTVSNATSTIEEAPVAAIPPGLSVPSVPSRSALCEVVMPYTSVSDCFADGLYRKERQTGMLAWPQGSVYGRVAEWQSLIGRCPGIYSLYKKQYVYF